MLSDQVVVLIAHNPDKKGLFSPRERLELVQETLDWANVDHVYVVATRLYVAEWCRPGDILVRGIRDASDLAGEMAIAAFNRNPKVEKEKGRVLCPSPVETIWLPATSDVSSSKAKELAKAGDPNLSYAVAPGVAKRLKEKLS
jgi:pantetheine-phosphate adenylyltransferase